MRRLRPTAGLPGAAHPRCTLSGMPGCPGLVGRCGGGAHVRWVSKHARTRRAACGAQAPERRWPCGPPPLTLQLGEVVAQRATQQRRERWRRAAAALVAGDVEGRLCHPVPALPHGCEQWRVGFRRGGTSWHAAATAGACACAAAGGRACSGRRRPPPARVARGDRAARSAATRHPRSSKPFTPGCGGVCAQAWRQAWAIAPITPPNCCGAAPRGPLAPPPPVLAPAPRPGVGRNACKQLCAALSKSAHAACWAAIARPLAPLSTPLPCPARFIPPTLSPWRSGAGAPPPLSSPRTPSSAPRS